MRGAGHLLFEFVLKSDLQLIWRAWVPSKLYFRGLARVLGAGHLLSQFVFKRIPKLLRRTLGPFQTPFSIFGSRAWGWSFSESLSSKVYLN